MGYTNFCTIPLEDESHGLKEKAKIQSKKASRTAHICICKLLSTCGTCSTKRLYSSVQLTSQQHGTSTIAVRLASQKPLSARVHRHTEKSAATCCEIPTSEGRSLSPSPPSAEVQVKRRELSGCDKTFADVLSLPSDVFEPSNQGQATKSTINHTCSTSHPSELSVETPRAVQATTCRRNT